MRQLLIAAVLPLFMISQHESGMQVESPPSTQAAAAASEPEDLSGLNIAELIQRLPAAGCEWRWDDARQDGVTDPAAAEMKRRITRGTKLTDEQWRLALLSTGAIRFHPKWPQEEEYCVSLTIPRWLGLAQIRLNPQLAGLHATQVGELLQGFSGTGAMIDARDARMGRAIGKLPVNTNQVTFDVEVERGKSLNAFAERDESVLLPPGILWKGAITVPVQLVDKLNQIADPVDNDATAAAVRDAVGARFRQWGEVVQEVPFLVIDPDCTKFPFLETIGLDIKVELLEGDKVIAESWLVAGDFDELSLASSIQKGKRRFYGWTTLKIEGDRANQAAWVLKLSGRLDHISLLWHATQYWSGTISMPWMQAVEHEKERTAVNGRGPEMSTPYWK